MPRLDTAPDIAIIGAGISGLVAADTLKEAGLNVTVFEKSRGVGGRMSTRRIDDGVSFDHGAQYFTARDQRFKNSVDSWIKQGIVARWPDPQSEQKIVVLENGVIQSESNSQDRYVATPTMNAICKSLAKNQLVYLQVHIQSVVPTDEGAELFDKSGKSLGVFDHVIVSAPAGQASELLKCYPALKEQIAKIKMNPCWATMVSLPKAITSQWVGAFLDNSFLSWVARNNTKPDRANNADHLVIHATPQWTTDNWDQSAEDVANEMLGEFWRVTGLTSQTSCYLRAHRWKYAIPVHPSDACTFVDGSGVALACGDWTNGSRVECGFLSGLVAADFILKRNSS